MWHIWVREILGSAVFFELLLSIDRDLVREAAKQACPHCGGRLDRADYGRKPRGIPEETPEEFSVRFSLCCARDGCRKRLTPTSARFLARKVYVGAAVVLIAAALQGPSPARIERLTQAFGASRRTIRRWLSWWRTRFVDSPFFRSLRGLLPLSFDSTQLPTTLLDALMPPAETPANATKRLLRLLLPITTATAPGAQPI